MQEPDTREISVLNRIVTYSAIVVLLILVFVYYFFLSGKSGKYETYEDFVLGTYVQIRLSSNVKPEKLAKIVFEEMRRIQDKFDAYNSKSVIYMVNNSDDWVEVDDETLVLIDTALKYARLTEGAFDPTLGRLIKLWGFDKFSEKEHFFVPPDEEIQKASELSGYEKVEIDYRKKIIKTNGVWFDLGGIAKGYALKRAYQIIKEFDPQAHGFIDAGGHIMIIGPKFGRTEWVIGVRNPRGRADENVTYLYLKEGSVATSGDYERFFIVDGIRYHHLLDRRNGKPATSAMSATVITDDPIVADVLSTAAFVLGKERWLFTRTLFPKYRTEVLLIDDAGKQYRTDGFFVYEKTY